MDRQASPPAKQPLIPLNLVLITSVVLLCAILTASGRVYYFNGPCGVNRVKDAGLALAGQFGAYQGAHDIAVSAARIALAGPAGELQKIYLETEKIEVPGCMEHAKSELVAMMDSDIEVFLVFMSEEASKADVTALMAQSSEHLEQYKKELKMVRECAPFCP